jgi:osmotically inducible protein OsmC
VAESHFFSVRTTWEIAKDSGRVRNDGGSFDVEHRGAAAFGGAGGAVNPEELLLSGVSTCFAHTWGIFVKKLGVRLEELRIHATCLVAPDPAGGFRVTEIELFPEVPKAIWESQREKVEKILTLAEKYCIVSKAVRGEGRTLKVTPRPV